MTALGRWGEERAADFLCARGFEIVAMNYRTRYGELDIVAQNHEFLVFVEVKLRKNNSFARAREFVTRSKQEKIKAAASLWLEGNDTELQPRFDVIELYAPNGEQGRCEVLHIENAFE